MDSEVTLSLSPKSAILTLGASKAQGHGTGQRVNVEAALDEQDDMRFHDNKSLIAVDWHVQVGEGQSFNDWAEERSAIGILSDLSEKRYDGSTLHNCNVAIVLAPEAMHSLVANLRHRMFPSRIVVTVNGIEYDTDAHRGIYVWDTSTSRALPIIAVSFQYAIATPHQ